MEPNPKGRWAGSLFGMNIIKEPNDSITAPQHVQFTTNEGRMGRKSREKRERRGKSLPDEVLELAPGITIARKGRFIRVENNRTPEEHAKHSEYIESVLSKLPDEIDSKIKKARELLKELPSPLVLSLIAHESFAVNPETYKEHEAPMSAAVVEYATWLAITNEAPPKIEHKEQIPLNKYEQLKSILQQVISETTLLWNIQHSTSSENEEKQNKILFRSKIENLIVRQPAHPKHQKDILRRIFEPFNTHLAAATGNTINSILNFVDAISNIINERATKQLKDGRDTFIELKTALKNHKQFPPEHRDLAEKLRTLSKPESKLQEMITVWLINTTDSIFRITPQDLAQATHSTEEAAQSFLEIFSTGFNQKPSTHLGNDRPSLYEPLEKTPLIKLPTNEWLAHLASPKLLTSIQPSLEEILKKKTKAWHQYERSRGTILENLAIELITSLNAHAKAYKKLFYRLDDGKGIERFELDGLIIIDDTAFIIEAKSGVVRLPGRRGAPSIVEDVKKLVGEAHAQALRAIRYIESAETVVFEYENGKPAIELHRRDITRILPIAVTLDHLTAFVTRASDLVSLGVIANGVLPWAVYINDLRVIVEQTEGIGQLVHYLERRMDIEKLNVTTHDELDWFCFYIKDGLYLEDEENTMPLHIMSHTEPLDDYYLYEEGLRKTPAEKLRQNMPMEIRELILNLERVGVAGFIEAIISLLNGVQDSRSGLAQLIKSNRDRSLTKDFSPGRLYFSDRAFIYAAYTGSPPHAMSKRYFEMTKYDSQKDLAVAIYQSTENPSKLSVTISRHPWIHDILMERRAAKFFGSMKSTPISPSTTEDEDR